ncbi:MAG: pyridoxamine 5'-phosphate oxidase family protein [Chloroflexi bacterium]|nr:pyridoxamine 5'-phosphate oxidase family protein [Chloroflexota bacterium]
MPGGLLTPGRRGQRVPSVDRALLTLEELARQPAGATLSDLSRATVTAPSTLLSILNTLRQRGYVERDDRGGNRYRLGAAAQRLTRATATPAELHRAFGRVADHLLLQLGETVLLWVLEGAEAVLADHREGAHTLRFVPEAGDRRPAVRCAAGLTLLAALSPDDPLLRSLALSPPHWSGPLVERLPQVQATACAELLAEQDGVWEVAAPVLAADGRVIASLGLAGPATRAGAPQRAEWRQQVGASAALLSAQLGAMAYHPYAVEGLARPWSGPLSRGLSPGLAAHGPLSPAQRDLFLSQDHLGRLACVQENGHPYTVPLWFEWDGDSFWLVPQGRPRWADHVRRTRHVSMTIDEPYPPLRRVIVDGQVEVVEEPTMEGRWREVLARMALRYLGRGDADFLDTALRRPHGLYRIAPERLVTGRGLTPQPVHRGAGRGAA